MLAFHNRERLLRRCNKMRKSAEDLDIYGFRRPNHRLMVVQSAWKSDLMELGGFSKSEGRAKKTSKGIKEKIKPSPCNQLQCEKIKERRDRHRLEHHSKSRNKSASIEKKSPLQSKSVILHSVKTKSKILNKLDLNNNQLNSKDDNKRNDNKTGMPLKITETRQVLAPKKILYKDHLQEEVLKWFLDIPVFPNFGNEIKLKRMKLMDHLVRKINDLFPTVDDRNYYENVRHEIENCLDVLPMWIPDEMEEKNLFKKNLCLTLMRSIKKLNNKWLDLRNDAVRFNNGARNNHIPMYNVLSFPFDDALILENEIKEWVSKELKFKIDIRKNLSKKVIVDILINRIMPVLKTKTNLKFVLKAEIIHILEDISVHLDMPKHRTMHMKKLAINLTERILRLNDKNQPPKVRIDQIYGNKVVMHHNPDDQTNHVSLVNATNSVEIGNIVTYTDDFEENHVKEITDMLNKNISSLINVNSIVNDLCKTSGSTGNLLRKGTSNLFNEHGNKSLSDHLNLDTGNQSLSGTLVVLTSKHELSGFSGNSPPLTSTPLLLERKKEISKFNAAEKAFISKVVELVRVWLDTTDAQFLTPEENLFKETIAYDIAVEVKDMYKFNQILGDLTPPKILDLLDYIIIKAINKYELLVAPVRRYAPQVTDLKQRILNLGEPDLTMPQHGNRQEIASIKHRWENIPSKSLRNVVYYEPDPLVILEDNISVWMNEQPSSIYKNEGRCQRNKQLHDVAVKLQNDLEAKNSEEEIKKDLVEWLSKIVTSNANKDVDSLAENLKERIIKLPQYESIRKEKEKKNAALAEEDIQFEFDQYSEVNLDPDGRLKEFVEKFIEQNLSANDSLVKGAYGTILLHELLKLSPTLTTEERNTCVHEKFNSDKFRRELEYIKEVSDWLKNMPFYSYLTSRNDRVEFVNGLAKNIADIEEEKIQYPNQMNYDLMLFNNISEYLIQLPLSPQDRGNLSTCVDQLAERVRRHRPPPACCPPVPNQPTEHQAPIVLAQFIEKFVDLHSQDIGDDELKREAYVARLIQEVKKIVREKGKGGQMTKRQLHNRLADVPFPNIESTKLFVIELRYVQEIVEWLHNFPLIPLSSYEENETRIKMISGLAEKMIERDQKIIINPMDTAADVELDAYINNWINQLNLDRSKEIVVPILISQLKKRMENVKMEIEKKEQPVLEPESNQNVSIRSLDRSRNKRPVSCARDDPSFCNSSKAIKKGDPGELIVEAIEGWCNELPINDKDMDTTKAEKEKVATNIFKKVGSLNVDPQTAKDDLLYKEILSDEVETELNNLSGRYDIENEKENLKASLVDKVMDTRKVIKSMSAGENYKQALENTIDASLPNPVRSRPNNDPGYELYKNRVAMLWLLENYDYSIDYNSLQYKKKLSEDIDKYSGEAQKRNILPMDKHEIYNEIYSALYKQNPPCEWAIVEEVENIKTRCEIDAWFKELPLEETSNFQELLKRDQIVSALAKKIYDIEQSQTSDVDEKMHKETLKWLDKLPLLPGEDKNKVMYVDKLLCHLKATRDVRKCKRQGQLQKLSFVSEPLKHVNQTNETKDRTILDKSKVTNKTNASQIAGPSGIKPCCKVLRRKAPDIITSAVETWCDVITEKITEPLRGKIKDQVVLRIYQILNDLHGHPDILSNEGLYEHYLNIEIEKILLALPGCCEILHTKNEKRTQLITMLMSVRPLIKDELDREGYKQNLKHALSSFFEKSVDPNAKEFIIDNFIQISYHKDEFEDQQSYKNKIDNTLVDVLQNDEENPDADILLTRNQLICEMSKVKPPKQSVLIDEVQEIKMKDEITEFFKEVEMPESTKEKGNFIEQMKLILAKKLIDVEDCGQKCSNDQKMKAEITKTLNKLGATIDPKKIDAFVEHLRQTEDKRKALPINKDGCSDSKKSSKLNQKKVPNMPLGPSLLLRSPPQPCYVKSQLTNGENLFQNSQLQRSSSLPYDQGMGQPPTTSPFAPPIPQSPIRRPQRPYDQGMGQPSTTSPCAPPIPQSPIRRPQSSYDQGMGQPPNISPFAPPIPQSPIRRPQSSYDQGMGQPPNTSPFAPPIPQSPIRRPQSPYDQRMGQPPNTSPFAPPIPQSPIRRPQSSYDQGMGQLPTTSPFAPPIPQSPIRRPQSSYDQGMGQPPNTSPFAPPIPQSPIRRPQSSYDQGMGQPSNTSQFAPPTPRSPIRRPQSSYDQGMGQPPNFRPSLDVQIVHSPPNSFHNQQIRSLTPDYGKEQPQAFRQDAPNVYLNPPAEGTGQSATRTTVRAQGTCQTTSKDTGTDIETDNGDDCDCKRFRKNKNCKGPCNADEPVYCNECENDYDCYYDFMRPYPMIAVPSFVYF